jgi:hypothetical protein
MVQVPGERENPAQADPPVGRLEANHPAQGGRDTDRAPVSLPSDPRHSPAARAAALPPDDPPGVRSSLQGLYAAQSGVVSHPQGDLVHVQLAEQDSTIA